MTRRVLAILVLLTLALSVAVVSGCSAQNPSEPANSPEQESPVESPETDGDTESESESEGTSEQLDGKTVIAQRCGVCHPAENADQPQGSSEKAEALVNDMISKGAQLTDQEKQAVIEYLSR